MTATVRLGLGEILDAPAAKALPHALMTEIVARPGIRDQPPTIPSGARSVF